jgi:hypothetical protein
MIRLSAATNVPTGLVFTSEAGFALVVVFIQHAHFCPDHTSDTDQK